MSSVHPIYINKAVQQVLRNLFNPLSQIIAEVRLPYQLPNEPGKHKADCEQRDGNPKWWPVAFTYSVHDGNDQRD